MTNSELLSALPVAIARRECIAKEIYEFEFRALNGQELPEFEAGAHIQVEVSPGVVRKYSLSNDPRERDRYVIAVKHEPAGRGGSADLISKRQQGQTIRISGPKNDFGLSSNARSFIFIAGGIGITPIVSMVRHLQSSKDRPFKLYYCTRSFDETAFRDELSAAEYKGRVILHHDEGNPDLAIDLWSILETPKDGVHLYCCGPMGLMSAVRGMTGHWSPKAVHFEAFVEADKTKLDDKAFEVILDKAGVAVNVPVGTSILEAMRANGYDGPSSCESGTCGTCKTKLLSGEVEHRDLVLSEHERSQYIMICVSRARGPRITIDR